MITYMLDDDVTKLRQDYPDWQISTVWATAASGPDVRRLMAYRQVDHQRVLLSAWNAAELSNKIRTEEESS